MQNKPSDRSRPVYVFFDKGGHRPGYWIRTVERGKRAGWYQVELPVHTFKFEGDTPVLETRWKAILVKPDRVTDRELQ